MRLISGGELVVDCLRKQGVRKIFSIIGGQMGSIYDAVGRRDDIDIFVPRCETAGPLMACGYAAATGEPAVSMTTVGAGVVYEVAGLSHAWLNYHPVISIAPQVQSWKMKPHQENLQACNQDEIFAPVTKWNAIVYHWRRIPQMVARGFREAYTGVPGPVHLDVPVDVLFRRGLWREKQFVEIPVVDREPGIAGIAERMDEAAAVLKKAKRPLVLVGQGMGRWGRYRNLRGLLNQAGWPVLTTRFSSGIMCSRDSCYVGPVSLFAEADEGTALLKATDVLVLVGVDPEAHAVVNQCGWTVGPVVQVETEPSAMLPDTRHPIHADPASAFSAWLAAGIRGVQEEAWLKTMRQKASELAGRRFPADRGMGRVLAKLGEKTDASDIVVADGAGLSEAAVSILRGAEYRDLFCMDERDMAGVGLPFAIGAALGDSNVRVNLICDKESLFAHVRELAPAGLAGVTMRIVVVDDDDAAVNCADTAAVLEGFGCRVKKISLGDGEIEIPAVEPRTINALVLEPESKKR
jgi:acetolactate synthase-1/2/3 large subunit